jgi:flagella basal body P-ring formation protein FlgA
MSLFATSAYRLTSLAVLAALGLSFTGAAAAATLGEPLPIRLNASVTVTEEVIRLGDLFSGDFGGDLSRGDKVVAQSPAPGQRVVLAADWLATLARNNGVDWRPAGPYDRAMIFRPGQTIQSGDVIAAIRAELVMRGMPKNYGLKSHTSIGAITIGLNANKAIVVREAVYDAASNGFSAVAEIAAGDPSAVFVPIRGSAMPVVNIPTLKQGLARNTVITAEMIEHMDVPEMEVAADAVMDINALIGKAPRGYLKSGQAIRQNDIYHLTLTEIPVLRAEMRRGGQISAADIAWVAVNADDVPSDVVTDETQLIGKSPKRYLAARAAIRRGDVQNLSMVDVPTAARDVRRGASLSASDITWVSMSENDIVGDVVRSEKDLVGLIANSNVRAGQPFRTISVIRPIAIPKGKTITVVYTTRAMSLTSRGKVLEDGAVGQVVRVTNTKSNQTVFAEVLDAETVRVTEQQTAMN